MPPTLPLPQKTRLLVHKQNHHQIEEHMIGLRERGESKANGNGDKEADMRWVSNLMRNFERNNRTSWKEVMRESGILVWRQD